MPKLTPPPSPKLNLLALPPYTAVFFALIALVILGAAFASLLPYSQIWWAFIVLPLTLLPLRDFLHWPDREKSTHCFRPPTPDEASIQQAVNELSQQAGMTPPQVFINEDDYALYTFGTFRRHFISVGANMAGVLAQELTDDDVDVRNTARALLAHEIAHFANGDMRRAALARSMLKITLWTALVSMWAGMNLVVILMRMGPEVTSQAFWNAAAATIGIPGISLQWVPEMMRAQNPYVFDLMVDPTRIEQFWGYAIFYIENIYLPFLVAVPVLYLFFWRKLMRVREFYADLRAASWIGDSQRVIDAMTLHKTLAAMRPPATIKRLARLSNVFAFSIPSLGGILAFHPTEEERKEVLHSPLRLFGAPWRIAFWTGVAVLLLEIILRSSLTMIYIAQPAPYLPLLTATAVFSVWLLPRIYAGENFHSLLKTSFRMAAIFILVKLSINFLDAIFLAFAAMFGQLGAVGGMLDAYLRSMLGGAGATVGPIFGGEFGWAQIIDWQIIRPIAYYLFFGIPLLTAALAAFIWLIQKTLTWYRAGRKIVAVFWGVLLALLLAQLLLAYPIANLLFFPMIYDFTWKTAFMVIAGLLLLAIAIPLFYQKDRRYARVCPKCGQSIAGDFTPGQACPHCRTPLHPWLNAPYLLIGFDERQPSIATGRKSLPQRIQRD